MKPPANPLPPVSDLRAILFDLDGTLLDSFPGHFHAYQVMFAHFGIPVSSESFFELYAPDWQETYRRSGLPRERWAEADRIWLAAARQVAAPLFPGVPALLDRLAARWQLGLVTSGSRERVLADMERTGLAGRFAVVVTGGDVQRPKPDPQGLLLALRALDTRPDQALYVGDAQADYLMARAGGVAFIGVESRFASLPPETPAPRLAAVAALGDLLDG